MGYDVYDFNFGEVDFSKADPTFSSSFAYPEGTIIVGFFEVCTTSTSKGKGKGSGSTTTTSCDTVTTAQSAAGAIEYTTPNNGGGGDPNTNVPEPSTWALLLASIFGADALRRYARRRAV